MVSCKVQCPGSYGCLAGAGPSLLMRSGVETTVHLPSWWATGTSLL